MLAWLFVCIVLPKVTAMLIISTLSQCASPEKRDIFLSHIKDIAAVTLKKEPNCHGYAWFLSAGDNEAVPSYWLRGFEVYASAEANQVEHRASSEYKAFRSAVAEEKLLSSPSDLRFWHPTGIGFLTKRGQEIFVPHETGYSAQYVVTEEFVPRNGMRSEVFDKLRTVASAAQEDDSVLSFWVQDRVGVNGTVPEESEDETVYVLFRCKDKPSFDRFVAQADDWKGIEHLRENSRTTTWVDSGLGFIGR